MLKETIRAYTQDELVSIDKFIRHTIDSGRGCWTLEDMRDMIIEELSRRYSLERN